MTDNSTHHQENAQREGWGTWRLFAVATIVGLLAGVAAWLFRLLIGVIHNLAFFGQWSTIYDANLHTPTSSWGWLIIFVPAIGGILVVYLVKNFAPEAKGHGVPEVMDAIFHRRGRIRGEVSVVKALASAVTIGTGGSLGREGPIVQISAAFSSAFAQWLKLPMSQRNLLIACGASGGIAATFNAPIGGVLFSVELLMLSVTSRTIMPVIISAVVAANMGRYLIGPEPAFHVVTANLTSEGENPLLLAVYFPFAAVVGMLGLIFIKSVYWSENQFDRLPMGPYSRHLLGMLVLGVLMYELHVYTGHYYVQGVGYAAIQDIVSGALTSPWLLLLLLGAKLLATLLTIGSGGSGGVFSPSLFLGATIGGVFGYTLSHVFPGLGIDPVAMSLVGMASMVAATTSAPMTAALMTYELTQDYVVMLPIMVGVAVAYSVRRYFSVGDIYTLKLMSRGQNVPQGLFADMNSHIIINDIMASGVQFVQKDDLITGSDCTCCVVNEENKVVGVINPISYRQGVEFTARDALLKEFVSLRSGMTVRQALIEIVRHKRVVGVVSKDGSLDADKVIGVLNPFNLTRVIASSSLMHEPHELHSS